MLAVISPAKNLDFESQAPSDGYSEAELLDEAEALIEVCRKLTPADLASLMKLSDKLAGLNVARFQQWQRPFTADNAKQAIFAFNGDVYTGFDAASLSEQELAYTQSHLRILSGLYGVLKPLDRMQAYRLEMGTKLANPRGKDLYAFWGSTITDALNRTLAGMDSQVVVNLASNEYFKAVKPALLNAQVVTPVFKDFKNGQYKIISFYAKKARGMMARFMAREQVTELQQLEGFSEGGYRFSAEQSDANTLVFLRDQV
ncbi:MULTISPECIES: peroxide stress protein YaaA [Ferrimonas]|uniref:peroxide stress protein YaaA n=1 Tax=Ferrimonas TaxID=44011 RepID=UPI000405F868|nr:MULTISPECIES: peroxide stress protein YaaA [Ferrimonas]USD38206.1 peroxide stress protein YaaA [Ferrimonas sp. SCSIO 43195]